MEQSRKRVGIFGGSFDPVHAGHLHLAGLARGAAGLDEVWFMPCAVSPHKSSHPPTEGKERVKWLRAALRNVGWARVCEIELEMEGASYSYRTMEKLRGEFAGYDWYWIMGGDQWEALPRWKHPEVLAELVTFVVLARGGVAVEEREGFRMIQVVGEHPASSTVIREALRRGEVGIEFLDEEVELLMRGV